MTIKRFQVFNTMHGETIAIVEMDSELLRPEAKILDPDSLTLRHLKNGGVYTLYPMENHLVTIVEQLRQNYDRLTKTPAGSMGEFMSRTDSVVSMVGSLFEEVTYIVIESAEDLENVISPPKGEYTPKTKQYNVLDDILEAARTRAE